MIKVTRLNGSELTVNGDLLETIEATPDSVLTLTTGHKYVVRESVEEIVAQVVSYKRAIFADGPRIIN